MSFSERITELVDAIASYSMTNVFNPWAEHDDRDASPTAPADRRRRLLEHFRCEPALLLIGEAPGYRGCHFAGVPFTSEALLMEDVVPRVRLPADSAEPTKRARITSFGNPLAEASATIVWRELYANGLEERVVMWNAFPWHPHKPDNPMSNRTPTPPERAQGLRILAELISIYQGVKLFPVGRLAQNALEHLGLRYVRALRHPSMGGAAIFASGMRAAAAAVK